MEGTPQTIESVALAKGHQLAERQKFYAATGIAFEHDLPVRKVYREKCPRCNFRATSKRSGQELRSLAAHLLKHITEGN